jgi:hypothetical protein
MSIKGLKPIPKTKHPNETMTTQQLIEQIKIKKSFLAVGLDVDLNKIPKHFFRTRRSDLIQSDN